MRQFLRAVVLLACAPSWLGSTELPDPKIPWSRLKTANFTLFSCAKDSDTRHVARELETLRAVVVSVLDLPAAPSPVPNLVYLFPDDAAVDPYKPRFGNNVNIAAFFQANSQANYLALPVRSRDTDARRFVYQGLVFSLLGRGLSNEPTWWTDGLANYYSTFELSGGQAVIGRVVRPHLQTLRAGPLIPLERLLAISQSSSEYNDPRWRAMFEAESWALVHYSSVDAGRRAQLQSYLSALKKGVAAEEAFRDSFHRGYGDLYGELRLYINGNAFHYSEISASNVKLANDVAFERISYERGLAALGDLIANSHEASLPIAEGFFQAALGRDPNSASALSGLGLARRREGRWAEATEYLRKAMAAGSDDFRTYFEYGRLRMLVLSERPVRAGQLDPEQRAALDEARSAFQKSLELNPGFAEAYAEAGRTYLLDDPSCASQGISNLETAVRLLPSRADLSSDLATLYELSGDWARGQQIRDKAIGPGSSVDLTRVGRKSEFEQSLDSVNRLLSEQREDEAVQLFEKTLAAQPEDIRESFQDQLTAVKRAAANHRAIRRYNEGVALANRGNLRDALAAFREVAQTAQDPDLSKKASDQVKQLEGVLARRK